jgi:hypothetical protein
MRGSRGNSRTNVGVLGGGGALVLVLMLMLTRLGRCTGEASRGPVSPSIMADGLREAKKPLIPAGGRAGRSWARDQQSLDGGTKTRGKGRGCWGEDVVGCSGSVEGERPSAASRSEAGRSGQELARGSWRCPWTHVPAPQDRRACLQRSHSTSTSTSTAFHGPRLSLAFCLPSSTRFAFVPQCLPRASSRSPRLGRRALLLSLALRTGGTGMVHPACQALWVTGEPSRFGPLAMDGEAARDRAYTCAWRHSVIVIDSSSSTTAQKGKAGSFTRTQFLLAVLVPGGNL